MRGLSAREDLTFFETGCVPHSGSWIKWPRKVLLIGTDAAGSWPSSPMGGDLEM